MQEELATQVKERSSSTSGAKRGKSKKEKGFQNFTRRLAGRQVCLRLGQCSVTQAPQQDVMRFLNNRKRSSRRTYITRHRQQIAQKHLCTHLSPGRKQFSTASPHHSPHTKAQSRARNPLAKGNPSWCEELRLLTLCCFVSFHSMSKEGQRRRWSGALLTRTAQLLGLL